MRVSPLGWLDDRLLTHLRQWGLLWLAGGIALLLVGSALRVWIGIHAHAEELGGVHAEHVMGRIPPTGTLEERLDGMRYLGVHSVTRFDSHGRVVASAGDPLDREARALGGAVPIERGRYRVEVPDRDGVLVLEVAPLLALDLTSRATTGLVLALIASLLLVGAVALWTRHRLHVETLQRQAERSRHLAHLGTLSAVIAHELRNPLTVLLGHTQLLREDLPDSRSLRHVEEGANRLDALLDSLLRFARTGEVTREPTSPETLLLQAIADCDTDRVIVRGSPPETWELDRLRMRQVLTNLLSNALTSDPDGMIEATVSVDVGALVFEIRDHGAGIPSGMHEQVFEPFHTTRAQGTGLGLAVARDIVEKHGGSLTAHDAPGGGARFLVRIPS